MSSRFFKQNDDYCEKTRNISDMLNVFEQDRNLVLDYLKEDPTKLLDLLWKENSPICKDDTCLFKMGSFMKRSIDDVLSKKVETIDSHVNFYICPQCKNMRRIIDLQRVKAGEPFIIECGERAGQHLVYQEQKIDKLYNLYEKMPEIIKKAYSHPSISDILRCSSATCSSAKSIDKSEMSYLSSDPFTNGILINWYLQGENGISKNWISWICNNRGYSLHDYYNIGTINNFQEFPKLLSNSGNRSPTAKADDKSPIDKDVVLGIIVQLVAVLFNLRKYEFSHGDPCTENLKFSDEPMSYYLNGVHITSPVSLYLDGFNKSGCNVIQSSVQNKLASLTDNQSKIRLYSKSVVADEEMKKRSFSPIVETRQDETLSESVNKANLVYILKDPIKHIKASTMFMYMKHLGLPIFSSSFDLYAFLIVLLSEKSFYYTLVSSTLLKDFWKKLWVNNDDFQKINDRLKDHHDKASTINSVKVLQMLADLRLRCDAIDFAWNMIKNF